ALRPASPRPLLAALPAPITDVRESHPPPIQDLNGTLTRAFSRCVLLAVGDLRCAHGCQDRLGRETHRPRGDAGGVSERRALRDRVTVFLDQLTRPSTRNGPTAPPHESLGRGDPWVFMAARASAGTCSQADRTAARQ